MSNVAYKTDAAPNIHIKQAPIPEPSKQPLRRGKVTLGEKLLISIAVAIVLIMAFRIISVQAQIYSINEKTQNQETKVSAKEKQTDDLSTEVKSLSRYERVYELAKKKGLKLNGENVKVVGGQ